MLTIREPSPDELRQWEAEFDAAARRPLEQRLKYAFVTQPPSRC
jgi:hypothetical protein